MIVAAAQSCLGIAGTRISAPGPKKATQPLSALCKPPNHTEVLDNLNQLDRG